MTYSEAIEKLRKLVPIFDKQAERAENEAEMARSINKALNMAMKALDSMEAMDDDRK